MVLHAQRGSTLVPRNPSEILEMLTSDDAARGVLKFLREPHCNTAELPGVKIKVERFIQVFSLIYALNIQLDLEKSLTIETIIASYPEIMSEIDQDTLLYFLSFFTKLKSFIQVK
jgi:hypothetical protein